jgi:hypothetical protein
MKRLFIALLLALSVSMAWAGSFSTGAIDTVARANAAVAISKLDGGVAASNVNVTGGTITISIATSGSAINGANTSNGQGINGSSTGVGYGVQGSNNGAGYGVYGWNSSSGKGVYGSNTSTGIGVYAANTGSGYGLAADKSNFTNYVHLNGVLLFSATAPTINGGFGTSPSILFSNGTATFLLQVGTGGTATNGGITFSPAAPNGWNCFAVTTVNEFPLQTVSSGGSPTTITLNNINVTTGAATAWAAGAIIRVSCLPY